MDHYYETILHAILMKIIPLSTKTSRNISEPKKTADKK
jgi:hypothetical protein